MKDHQFLAGEHQASVLSSAQFELRCLLGPVLHNCSNRPPEKYLQLGCAFVLPEGFTNVDVYVLLNRKRKRQVYGHDLRRPLPFPSDVFLGAFSEHTLEHLYPVDVVNLFREVYRVLRPGAYFRCTVPDLGKYVAYYNGANLPGFEIFENGCEAIRSVTQNYQHLSCWDETMLTKQLRDVGFSAVARKEYCIGDDPHLLLDIKDRQWETLYVEARK